jgi:tetratricopeptide (TPR) repeat protein
MSQVFHTVAMVSCGPTAVCRCAFFIVLLGAYSDYPLARAQDIVYFSHPRTRGETRLTGEVLDYKGKQLEIRVEGQPRTVSAEQVRRIEFRKQAVHAEGDKLFAAHDFSEARNRYQKARLAEPRAWVQRLLIAQIVWCDRHLEQFEVAGDRFLSLLADDPETPYFEALPLAWVSRPLSPAGETKALSWLGSDQPAAQLLGASHLLMTRHRAQALDKLQTLRFHKDPRLAGPAKTQIWRSEMTTASSAKVAQWQEELDKIPERLRAGGYYVVGNALARQQQTEDAALALLRVPVLYPQERNLAARCLADAAQLLAGAGKADEAARLKRELTASYAETRDAEEAKTRTK